MARLDLKCLVLEARLELDLDGANERLTLVVELPAPRKRLTLHPPRDASGVGRQRDLATDDARRELELDLLTREPVPGGVEAMQDKRVVTLGGDQEDRLLADDEARLGRPVCGVLDLLPAQ